MDRAAATEAAKAPQPVLLKDYRPPSHLIDQVGLTVVLNDDETVVRSTLHGRRNPDHRRGPADLQLDGEDQVLDAVVLNGAPLGPNGYALDAEGLSIPALDGDFTLEVTTRIRPQDNTSLEGLYASGGMYCTQCEAEGFRRITYFPDRPDVMATYTVRIEAEKEWYPVLLSNGNRTDAGDLGDGRHYAVWHDPFPKPSYLFAMVAGDLAFVEDRYVTGSGREVTLRIYVEHGNEARTGHAMDSLKRSMAWDEEVYGLEYDLDIFMIVAVSFFNMGAMENKGLNIFNDKFILADPSTATDADFQRIEAIVAHEYFHNWSGNRVTCRDWFQLSLKEGLTVLRDQEFTADTHSRGVKRVEDVRLLRTAQFPEDSGPTAHPIRPDRYLEINNFYTVTVYEKGAEVVRMIHTLLGPEAYRKGTDIYFERHDGQAVTCEDFVAAMEDASGVDLSRFRLWYEQAGTPTLKAAWSQDDDRFTLTLEQTVPDTPGQANKKPQPIPVRIALLDADGAPVPLVLEGEAKSAARDERVIVLNEAEESFLFEGVSGPVVPSLLRGFSAPVKLEAPFSAADLAFLSAKDGDPFARWEAGQVQALRALPLMVDGLLKGETLALDPAVVDAASAALDDDRLEMAFRANLLALPGESVIGQAMDVWHVDEAHSARETARATIAEALYDRLVATYRDLAAQERPGDLSTEAMARARSRMAVSRWLSRPAERKRSRLR